MPAVQPARLKQQAALLAQHFEDPPAFLRSLYHLLDFYADRTHRPGQSGEPPSLLQAYNVPAPVIRLLLQTLGPLAEENMAPALILCDTLWKEPYLEARQLAVGMLGRLPVPPSQPILNRVQRWVEGAEDQRLVDFLLDTGLAGLRRRQPEVIVDFIDLWLSDRNTKRQELGLR
ncbi:MAG TPA: DNA alkylation repair protein, partial [Anaerolineales bacterium]|nr:DNA alkylation repair protein [Anaerolineales bacterium]